VRRSRSRAAGAGTQKLIALRPGATLSGSHDAGLKGPRYVGVATTLIALVSLVVNVAYAQSPPVRRSLSEGLYTSVQADRGNVAYTAHCAECHMADLGGHEYAGPLAGEGFQLKWQDASLSEFLGRIRSMPLGRPGSLTIQQYLDILAYALQKNGYPDGAGELTVPLVTQWPLVRIERVRRQSGVAP
jgi:mono/diheme cytochrome c family protein